jgi:SAM-dependent methyltransferase
MDTTDNLDTVAKPLNGDPENMSKTLEQVNATEYEAMYQKGYGLVYPDGHIVRLYRHILEWELKLTKGRLFDFGCGSGSHLKYFSDHGFEPYGCDTSQTAIERCRKLMPGREDHFFVNEVIPDLLRRYADGFFDMFLSNQVLYFLDTAGIKEITRQAYEILKPGGVFAVSMMPRACWYSRHVTETKGDLSKVVLDTSRQVSELYINFREPTEWQALFAPFRKLHIGSYSWHIREDEGAHVHWLFVGVRPRSIDS